MANAIPAFWSEWRDSFAFSSRREENRGVAAIVEKTKAEIAEEKARLKAQN